MNLHKKIQRLNPLSISPLKGREARRQTTKIIKFEYCRLASFLFKGKTGDGFKQINFLKIPITTIIIVSLLLFSNCKNCKQKATYININSNVSALKEQRFQYGDVFNLTFGSTNYTVDSFIVLINGQKHRTDKLELNNTNTNYGVNSLKVTYFYDHGKSVDEYSQINVLSSKQETPITYNLQKEFYHNPKSFTQGLYYENGILFESSGNYNKSFIAKYPLGSQTYTTQTKTANKYFAEGIARLGDKIYQLTWQEHTILVYDATTLELQGEMAIPASVKEGWGICTDGEYLFMTDGTQYLYKTQIVDNQFRIVEAKQIVGYQNLYSRLNELEYIDGFIYANVWGQPVILKINPKEGIVEGILDLSEFAQGYPKEHVLNGIAYIDSHTLLVTGKYWDKMYQININ